MDMDQLEQLKTQSKIKCTMLLIDKKHYSEITELGFNSVRKYIKLTLLEENKLFESFNNVNMAIFYIDENGIISICKIFKKSKFIKEKSGDCTYYYSFEDYELLENINEKIGEEISKDLQKKL